MKPFAAALLLCSAVAAAREALPGPSLSAEDIAQVRAAALQAYSAGDFDSYLSYVAHLADELPNHPGVALRLAAAQARAGQKDAALATLDAIAGMGVTVNLADDERNAADFATIANDPKFAEWKRRAAANAQPIARSSLAHRFADAGLLTEDVSQYARDQSLFVSSVLGHKLVQVSRAGTESLFPLEAPENGWNVLGVQVDSKRGVVWVSAQAMRGFPGIAEADAGKSRLSAYGLKSKRRLYTHEFKPEPEREISLGDLALAPSGDLLAMDSRGGKLYRISADRRALDVLNQPFLSPQDAVITGDGKVAFIADYSRGIARIDLETGEQEWLAADRSIALSGIDGLYRYRKGFVAVQNGVQPARIAYFALDAEERRITRCDVLERGGALGEPTHGVVVGDAFVYLANAGWNKLDDHGAVRPGETLTPAELRRLPLPR